MVNIVTNIQDLEHLQRVFAFILIFFTDCVKKTHTASQDLQANLKKDYTDFVKVVTRERTYTRKTVVV